MVRTDVAVVVIGRNEGDRLVKCLRSLCGFRTVYVDSGSSDGSPDLARTMDVEVIELDESDGFSAARGRNAGIERLLTDDRIDYIQVLDGDCVLEAGWIEAGIAAFEADPGRGAVFGRLRERDPDLSIYAWLCDVEWAVPAGPADMFGGDVLFRTQALRRTGRYRASMIAGEDPDFALRMRAAGWRIDCLARPMAIHESAITQFRQWWRRTVRAGHAFAELADLHRGSSLHRFGRNLFRILLWGAALPLAASIGLGLAIVDDPRWLIVTGLAALLQLAQILRVALRERRRHAPSRALTLAAFLAIGKYAELIGVVRYHLHRRRGGQAALIEYKAP